MYFNKTHCSMTFDLFPVDLQLLTPLTLADDSGGCRSCRLPGVRRQRRRFIYTLMHVKIQHFLSRADRFVHRVDLSFSQYFFPVLFCPSINVKTKQNKQQPAAKSSLISLCISTHYIILSSRHARRLPSYGQSL